MGNTKNWKVLYLFALICVGVGSGLNCGKVAYLEQVGVLSWLGMIDCKIPVATNSSGWTMRLEFSQPFTGLGVWDGYVSYNGSERWAEIRNRGEEDAEMNEGDEKCMRFRVNYGENIKRPGVVSMKFQRDHEMCEAYTRKRYSF